MESLWRVACVRIPRFPIGAVFNDRARRYPEATAPRVIPRHAPRATRHALPIESSLASDGAPSPTSAERLALLPPPRPHVAPQASTPAHWDDFPVALASGQRLRAISSAAARARVRIGMTLSEARALCAELEVWEWDDDAITRAITETTAAFLAATPQVTPAAGEPGLWWAGAVGLDRVGGERELVRALARIARTWHPRARVAIAGSCVTARAASWASIHAPSRAPDPDALAFIVPPHSDAAYLAAAPLALIPMDEELRATLATLGIRTAGAFAALDAEDVERRWGEEGLEAWRLARGEDRRRPVLARAPAPRSVEVELSAPTTTMEPVLFLVRAALDQLIAQLVADGRTAAAIAITLMLESRSSWGLGIGDWGLGTASDGETAPHAPIPNPQSPIPSHTITRQVRFPRPLARTAPLFEQCRALLERWMLPAPACGVAVTITETAAASGEQGDLLALGWRDPGAVDAAFARLRAELGPGTVVRPTARDEHRPERAGEWEDGAWRAVRGASRGSDRCAPTRAEGNGVAVGRTWEATGLPTARHAPRAPRPAPLAFRLLDPPEPVEIERAEGQPGAVWWRGRRIAIERALGPERLSGDWWKDAYARDYWRCESESGDLLLFLDRMEQQWYMHGWYD
jgi:protein ImuB